MDHGAAIGDAEIFEDVPPSGLDVELDQMKPAASAGGMALKASLSRRQRSARFRQAPTEAGESGWCRRGLLPLKTPPRSMTLGGGRIGERFRWIGFQKHFLVADVEVVRLAAEVLRRDLGELRPGVHGRDVVGARLGVGGVAADLGRIPRQVPAAVAALDDAILPFAFEHLGGDARGGGIGVGAEIADAGVDVDLVAA
jgi:hypothetical protein